MKASVLLFISIFFATTPNVDESVFWGQNGHRATGEIATQHLTKRAKRKIDKLLKGQSLAFVSTFADEIKSDWKYSAFSAWHYVNMGIDENYETAEKKSKRRFGYCYCKVYFGFKRPDE